PPDPGLNREILKLQIRRVANDNAVSSAVEFKRLSDHSRNKGCVSLQIAAVPTLEITPVPFGRPPTQESGGSGHTGRYAFAGAASLVNRGDFVRGQGPVKNIDFIELSCKRRRPVKTHADTSSRRQVRCIVDPADGATQNIRGNIEQAID